MNTKSLARSFSLKLEKFTLVLAEYTFAGVVVGGLVSKELPFSRSTLLIAGIIGAVIFFGTSTLLHSHINNNNN
jgi:hypothetical protein